jgi:hypothetical protein
LVPKTYKQLKEESLHKPEAIQKITPELEPEQRIEAGEESEIELEPEPEVEVIKESESELETKPEVEVIKESEIELETKPEAEVIEESESELETKPEVEVIKESETELETKLEAAPEKVVEPMPEKQPEPEPAAMELTVEELLSAYETDPVKADEKFLNEVLRVTGVVYTVDIKDFLDTHYIRLTGTEKNFLQSVQCMFDKKHASLLAGLEIGQTVTVQGIFNGSMIAIRLNDCFLVT